MLATRTVVALSRWFLQDQHALLCGRPMGECTAAAAGPPAVVAGAARAVLNADNTNCCVIVRTTFHLTAFVGDAAGNVVAGSTALARSVD